MESRPKTYKADILIVDDTPVNLRLLTQLLSDHGYRVRPLANGTAALKSMEVTLPDLILLDVRMPEIDGYTICELLKSDPLQRDIPVIFLSALNEMEDKLRAFQVGGVDYITKPFQAEEVLARVETHLTLRRLQQQLQTANVELQLQLAEVQARNEELDAFSHTVAHDLKNPLGVVLGLSEYLEMDYYSLSDVERIESIQAIGRTSNKLYSIVESLLLLAGIRRQVVTPGLLDMDRIVAEALEQLSVVIRDAGAQIVQPEHWPEVLGYGPWVEEVWVNYISNAIKYGGQPSQVELGYDTFSRPEGRMNSPMVRFWVRDNGPGITREKQEMLFIPFERLGQAQTSGYGLGLSIVRRIVEKLGGMVGMENPPGQGCMFWFTLPS